MKDKQSKKEAKKKSTTRISGMDGGSRIKDMSSPEVIVEEGSVGTETTASKTKKAHRHNNKIIALKSKLEVSKVYPAKEAFELVIKTSISKFAGTVELHLNVLEKGLNGEIVLPNFKGKEKRIEVFTDALGEIIKSGKIDFDVLLATPADMAKILPLAKILGPKGLMPNPKTGTLTPNPEEAKKKLSGGGTHYKTEKDFPLIHLAIGKTDQPVTELVDNYKAVIKAINAKNIKKAVVKSSMGPAIKIAF